MVDPFEKNLKKIFSDKRDVIPSIEVEKSLEPKIHSVNLGAIKKTVPSALPMLFGLTACALIGVLYFVYFHKPTIHSGPIPQLSVPDDDEIILPFVYPIEKLTQEQELSLNALLHMSQTKWKKNIGNVLEGMKINPRGTIIYLVGQLNKDEKIAVGPGLESQRYTLCGNSLTLLEQLTDIRIDGQGRDWMGFSTHDHRGAEPSIKEILGPWEAWLDLHKTRPCEEWFWGMSYKDYSALNKLIRTPESEWDILDLEGIEKLKNKPYPYLIEKLKDNEYACGKGERFCDQANRLLESITGQKVGKIANFKLLTFKPEDPMRKDRLAIIKNNASMEFVQQQWLIKVLNVNK